MITLGVETSCDETAVAVVQDGCRVLSSVVLDQADVHGPHGGVVPELASRRHSERLPLAVTRALHEAGIDWSAVDRVAATYGPGLASSLLVGLSLAKGLALRLGKPMVAINHLQAHMYSPFLTPGVLPVTAAAPFLALVISGGHTCLVRWEAVGHYCLLGETLDDAAGEAFDKGAKLLGLGYPGGPEIDRLARKGNRDHMAFPQGQVRNSRFLPAGLDPRLCFSFSGVKTALRYHLQSRPLSPEHPHYHDVIASYQEAIVDAVVSRCALALGDLPRLVLGGGVSLNSRLRERLRELANRRGIELLLAEPAYCGDNAAMIAGLAAAGGGITGPAAYMLDATPSLPVCSG